MKATPVVYIYGEEAFLVDRALAEVEAEALGEADPGLNREVFEAPGATPADVLAAARTLPFLGGRRLVLVRNADRWTADQWKTLLPYLKSPNPSTCLTFVAAQLDRRTSAAKLLVDVARLVVCERPKERDMAGWARRLAEDAGLRLSPPVLQSLVLRVGPDLQLLSREVEKLRLFAGQDGEVTEEDVENLVGETRGTTVFALCDALGHRDLARALGSLRRLLLLGEPPPRLLYMIVRHFRILWIGRELTERSGGRVDSRAAAKAMGIPPFVVSGTLEQARKWAAASLKGAFGLFVRADLALKTGGGDEVLEALVLELCVAAKRKRPGLGRGAHGSGSEPIRP